MDKGVDHNIRNNLKMTIYSQSFPVSHLKERDLKIAESSPKFTRACQLYGNSIVCNLCKPTPVVSIPLRVKFLSTPL